jgi:hypothetical protein
MMSRQGKDVAMPHDTRANHAVIPSALPEQANFYMGKIGGGIFAKALLLATSLLPLL